MFSLGKHFSSFVHFVSSRFPLNLRQQVNYSPVEMGTIVTPDFADWLMRAALDQARKAVHSNEVPVGAVVWCEGEVIAAEHNLVEKNLDATAHAEVLAIRAAGGCVGSWRLDSSVLCVTLEPCAMCWGAIQLARIPVVIFGASQQFVTPSINQIPQLRVIQGVQDETCQELLRDFFKVRR